MSLNDSPHLHPRIDTKIGLWKKGETSETWLQGADWVVDAIDNIPTKVDLLAYCHRNNLKVFSSMGAGAKCDPTRCQIADISNTYEDPLAKQIRVRLRKMGITHGIPYVESDAIFSCLVLNAHWVVSIVQRGLLV